MKNRLSLILLGAVVAGQLGWLGYNYYARTEEIASAPVLTVSCDALDPRDMFRGDYVHFTAHWELPVTDSAFTDLLHWNTLGPAPDKMGMVNVYVNAPTAQDCGSRVIPIDQLKTIPAKAATNPDSVELIFDKSYSIFSLAGYWLPSEHGVSKLVRVVKADSALDIPRGGEIRTMVNVRCSDSVVQLEDGSLQVKALLRVYLQPNEETRYSSFRFYVPEKMGEPADAWREGQKYQQKNEPFPRNRIETMVDFACRGRNGLTVKQVYLNGIPWVEAIEQMRAGTFPLLPQE